MVGAGEDDAAVWRERDGSYTVATCDASLEGVHFDLRRQRPQDVGWRALAFALGDLAAKGARPTYGLISISIPASWDKATVEGVYQGMADLAGEVGLRLVGGDTTAAPATGCLSITLLGASSVLPRPRSRVEPGWSVGVTGPLGAGGSGRPLPLLVQGAELAAAGLCCGDISDGLLRELDKFCWAAPGLGAVLRLDSIPCRPGVEPLAALASGEEVELVCIGPPPLPAGLDVVGSTIRGGGVRVLDAQDREVQVDYRGYDHFG
jgi:thiamine-monophosphate kinase